jgi:hypothetical protein
MKVFKNIFFIIGFISSVLALALFLLGSKVITDQSFFILNGDINRSLDALFFSFGNIEPFVFNNSLYNERLSPHIYGIIIFILILIGVGLTIPTYNKKRLSIITAFILGSAGLLLLTVDAFSANRLLITMSNQNNIHNIIKTYDVISLGLLGHICSFALLGSSLCYIVLGFYSDKRPNNKMTIARN